MYKVLVLLEQKGAYFLSSSVHVVGSYFYTCVLLYSHFALLLIMCCCLNIEFTTTFVTFDI